MENSSIHYPFRTTMRNFCTFLEKRGLEHIQPISISYGRSSTSREDESLTSTRPRRDESLTSTLIEYTLDEGFDSAEELSRAITELQLFGRMINFESLITNPEAPTSIDEFIFSLMDSTGGLIMVEELVGRYWKFVFDDAGILTKIISSGESRNEYHRTTSEAVGKFFGSTSFVSSLNGSPIVKFFRVLNSWEYELIIIYRTFGPGERGKQASVTGEYFDSSMINEEDPWWPDGRSIKWFHKTIVL